MTSTIKAIDRTSIHRITSGQVVIDLQTAIKELVENSLDAGATNIEVVFKQYGLKSIQVADNGSGIAEKDHDSIALKHYTSKLESFSDLSSVRTFGFRGEALSSLCALCESVTVTTAVDPPMGVVLELQSSGQVGKRSKAARQKGTTILLTNPFLPLPVRRKEFERNAKREFGKALALLSAYALGPCCAVQPVRLTVSNQMDKGQKSVQLRTHGIPSTRASVASIWGQKSLDNLLDLNLKFSVERDNKTLRRLSGAPTTEEPVEVVVRGLISKFAIGCGRTGTDRQFFYVNNRPCNLSKVQKAFNEVYRSFNVNQSPFIVADFIIPTDCCDVNVSPDKRTIFLHSEENLVSQLKVALEDTFAPARSTYEVGGSQAQSPPVSSPSKRSNSMASATPAAANASSSHPLDVEEVDPISVAPVERDASTAPSTLTRQRKKSSAQTQMTDHFTALPPANRTTPSQNHDSMDVDTARQSPPAETSSNNSQRVAMIMDTSQVNWNRSQRKQSPSPVADEEDGDAHASTQQKDASDHIRKKRKSDSGAINVGDEGSSTRAISLNTKTSSDVQKDKSSTRSSLTSVNARQAQQDLRRRLAGFARSGSRIPDVDLDQTMEDDEEIDQLDESSDPLSVNSKDKDTMDVDQPSPSLHPLSASSDIIDLNHESSDPLSVNSKDKDTMDIDRGSTLPSSSSLHPLSASSDIIDLNDEDDVDDSAMRIEPSVSAVTPSSSGYIPRPEIIRVSGGEEDDITMMFDLSRVIKSWKHLRDRLVSKSNATADTTFGDGAHDAGLSNTENDDAADALSRTIEKADFGEMDILGQFNLGFIITRRRKDAADDLFIVDQHAADEKYNFETLQQTTKINSQKLFRPQALELTAADETLAIDNIDVLRKNGFEIDVRDEAENEASVERHLHLTAMPVSKSTVFDMKDLEELIHLLQDQPTGRMVRCSKARAMFAMRACRKSVMIGMPLNKTQMTTVVQHMGTMDQPWNCPHGRPTMRHLHDLKYSPTNAVKEISWSRF